MYAYKINLSQNVADIVNRVMDGSLIVKAGINDLSDQDMLDIMQAADDRGEWGIGHSFDIILSNGDENIVHDIINC